MRAPADARSLPKDCICSKWSICLQRVRGQEEIGVIEFGDYYFNFDDIRTDIDRDASIDEIFSWYNH